MFAKQTWESLRGCCRLLKNNQEQKGFLEILFHKENKRGGVSYPIKEPVNSAFVQGFCLESLSAALALLTLPRDNYIKMIHVTRNVLELNLSQFRVLPTKK